MKKLIIAILVIFSFASCQKDEFVSKQADNDVVMYDLHPQISVGVTSRATDPVIPAGHKLRYMLQIWNTSGTPVIDSTKTWYFSSYSTVSLPIFLQKSKSYEILIWADYVSNTVTDGLETDANASIADKYYNSKYAVSDGFKQFTILPVSYTPWTYKANITARDGFSGKLTIAAGASLPSTTITLKRPLAQLNFIATDWDALTTPPASVKIIYPTGTKGLGLKYNMSSSAFYSGKGGAAVTVTANITAPAAGTTEFTFFSDYIFAVNIVHNISFTIEFYTGLDGTGTKIAGLDYTLPALTDVPYKANFRTNVKGAFFSTRGPLVIDIEGGFENPDNNVDI